MGHYKLWPIVRHKQLNERINIDDVLRAYGRNMPHPSGYKFVSAFPPTFSSEMCICME